ncbi:MAG: HAMP domain-containing protein, partial [Angustibacter sp.]
MATSFATDDHTAHGVRGVFVNRGVRTKILTIVVLLGLTAAAVAATAITSFAKLGAAADRIAKVQSTLVMNRGTVHQNQLKARMLIAQTAAVSTPEAKALYKGKIVDNDAELKTAAAAVDAAGGETVMPSWRRFEDDFDAWRKLRDTELLPAAMRGDNATYTGLLETKSQPLIDTFVGDLDKATDELNAYSEKVAKQAQATKAAGVKMILLVVIAGLALATALAVVVANAIVGRLRQVQGALEAMGSGDLTVRADVRSVDEIGRMAAALGRAQEQVRGVVASVA